MSVGPDKNTNLDVREGISVGNTWRRSRPIGVKTDGVFYQGEKQLSVGITVSDLPLHMLYATTSLLACSKAGQSKRKEIQYGVLLWQVA